MIIFAASTGLQELLLNPIVDALPMKDSKRAKNMSLLHSFFAWGQIFVILATTGMLRLWGVAGWPRIIFIWAAIPPISAILFSMVPLESRVSKEKMLPVRNLLRQKIFWPGIAAIVCGGAAEVTMGQWASAFIERGLLLSKSTGDLLGVCGFSLMLALGRTAYGIWGEKIDIHAVMLTGSLGASILCYTRKQEIRKSIRDIKATIIRKPKLLIRQLWLFCDGWIFCLCRLSTSPFAFGAHRHLGKTFFFILTSKLSFTLRMREDTK